MKIKKICQKIDVNNNFSEAYPLGADAKNIDLEDGGNLEDKIKNIDNLIAGKANVNHASSDTKYGIGSEEYFGHLRISDNFVQENSHSDKTAISQKGIINMFNQYLLNILQVFYIINETILLSVLNTGWVDDNEKSKLILLSDYYRIEKDYDNNDILITKNVGNEKLDSKFGLDIIDEEQEPNKLIFYSADAAWIVNEATIRLVSDYFTIESNDKRELTLIIK